MNLKENLNLIDLNSGCTGFVDAINIASNLNGATLIICSETYSKYFKNYGFPVPGAMKGKLGIVSISYGGPMVSYWNFSFFDKL